MPIPKPKKGEKQNDFISRCMSDKTMNKEYPDQKQRTAICFKSWRDSKECKRDEQGRIIIAENVPLIIGATIGVDEDGSED